MLKQIAYPTGETQSRTYDAAGNLVQRQYSAGPDLNYSYDDLNRIASADGITLTYDEAGHVVNTQNSPASFGATYDDAGNLTQRTTTWMQYIRLPLILRDGTP